MNELELLARWPGWADKRPADLLNEPSWALRTRWGDEEVRLRLTDNRPRDLIALKIAFDDDEHFLGLGRREAFPDLAALWDRKADIPQTLVLALVERECGKLLQLLENTVRRQLRVIGLTDAEAREGTRGFEVVRKDGSIVADFALTVSDAIIEAFGDLAAIDVTHSSVRNQLRPAIAEYAHFSLGPESAALAPGDWLLVPELDNRIAARWCMSSAEADGKYHVRAAEPSEISFGEIADNTLPEIPHPQELELFFEGKLIATGRYNRLGEQAALAIEEVL